MFMGKKVKTLIMISVILCICLLLNSCSREYSSTDEEDYEAYVSEVSDAELYMPKLEELGDYENILVTRKTPNDIFISTTDAVALIVQYDEAQYIVEKSKIKAKYEFVSEGVGYVTDVDAAVGNFRFKVVDHIDFYWSSDHVELMGSQLLIIGFDDVNYKIAYLCHWDHARNGIESLDRFIKTKYVLD